jgi:hypothetical protein
MSYIKKPRNNRQKTGKPEMNNKPNMTTAHHHINPLHVNQINQINQWFRQTNPTEKCLHTGKVNSIDNQRVTSKNTKITGNKPAKPENTIPHHTALFNFIIIVFLSSFIKTML